MLPKKVALLTPWPPQHSGIADYAWALASAMRGPAVEVFIFTNCPDPKPLPGVEIHSAPDAELTAVDFNHFDGILFQLGNHPHFHGYMPELIRRYGGTVELHDLTLHHLVMGVHGLSDGGVAYFGWLTKAYGPELAASFTMELHKTSILESALAQRYTCADVITSPAVRVITHSRYAANYLEHSGRDASDLAVIALSPGVATGAKGKAKETGTCARIGVFGGVQANRKVDAVLRCLAQLNHEAGEWQLDVAGHIDDDMKYLPQLAEDLGISHRVKWYGRVSAADLEQLVMGCDLVVALRSPTMGETSAVVTHALSCGVPCIVSNVGWYSELPSFVIKVDSTVLEDQLLAALNQLLADRDQLKSLALDCIVYARDHLNMKLTADDILSCVLADGTRIAQAEFAGHRGASSWLSTLDAA